MYKIIKIISFIIALSIIADPNANAQNKNKSKLRKIQRQIEIKQTDYKQLQDVNQIIDKEIKNYNRELIIKAEKINLYEKHILKSTEQIEKLQQERQLVVKSFNDNNELLVEIIIAMLRIGKNPPPAILVNNDKLYNAIRAAKLLANVMPEITKEAKIFVNEIDYINKLKQQLQEKRKILAEQYIILQNKYDNINNIVIKRQKSRDKIFKTINQQKYTIEKLDLKVKNLKELIRKITEITKDKPIYYNNYNFSEKYNTLDAHIPFEKTRGTLKLPVNGKIVKNFGENDINGEKSKGIYIKTPPFGQVVSPIDGKIEYAGELGDYGGVIIINVGQGYRVIIAGMKKIYLKNGYFVLKGEPVGLMGDKILASLNVDSLNVDSLNVDSLNVDSLNADSLNVDNNKKIFKFRKNDLKAILYIEFRKNDNPTDSKPWWNKKLLNTG